MSAIFAATLGQRPEAITVALDLLLERTAVDEVALLYTAGVIEARDRLTRVLRAEYPRQQVHSHPIARRDGKPLDDILDPGEATDYLRAIYSVLRDYKLRHYDIHLLVSGGRKAMSVYATLAAGLTFGSRDRVWVILSPDALVQAAGQYHIPPGLRDQVHLVELPLLPGRIIPGTLSPDLLDDYPALLAADSPNMRFINSLSKAERRVAYMLSQNPYAANADLAQMLGKGQKTVETQLMHIYDRMNTFFDYAEHIGNKRQALIDVMRDARE